jgi:hypothetical protein
MDKEVPDVSPGDAIDLACEDDRVWFDWNSDRDYRLREVVPDEFAGLDTPPHGMIWRALVARISHEVRVRMPVVLPTKLPINDSDDDYLAQIFKQAAPENLQKAARAAKRRTLIKQTPKVQKVSKLPRDEMPVVTDTVGPVIRYPRPYTQRLRKSRAPPTPFIRL